MSSFLLSVEFPELAKELKDLLSEKPEFTAQIDTLSVVDRCRCGDEFCATMYTLAKPNGAWGKGHQNFMLKFANDIIILDSVDGIIAEIEILDRREIREKLLQMMP